MLTRVALAVSAALALFPLSSAAEETPRICFREDAAPFSFLDDVGTPAGYSVDICRRVLSAMGNSDPSMVSVTTEDRFSQLQSGACDLLCEATTVTMQRRAKMEFSLITFLTGTVLLFPRDLLNAEENRAIRVGLLTETTTFNRWQSGELRGGDGLEFTFVVQRSHEEAEVALTSGDLEAYIADREIVDQMLHRNAALAQSHQISESPLSYEPYAIAMRMGDDPLRVQVDEVIASLFRTNEILGLLDLYLPGRRDDTLLIDLFRLQSLPK